MRPSSSQKLKRMLSKQFLLHLAEESSASSSQKLKRMLSKQFLLHLAEERAAALELAKT